MQKTLNIQSVKVPNPEALKFVVEGMLLTPGAYEYDSLEAAKVAPLALKLFGFDYVRRVFISKNFVTITKDPESGPWEGKLIDLRIVLKKHLEARLPILPAGAGKEEELPSLESTLEEQIREVIEHQVRPATWEDGGDITFHSFKDGVVKVNLAGACVGCPFVPRTVKGGIEVLLKKFFPEVESVTTEDVNWAETQE